MSVMEVEPFFVITLYSHFFKATRISITGRKILEHFLAQWIQRAYRPQSQYSKFVEEPKDKIFGFSINQQKEYRFHIGQFKLLKEFLAKQGYGPEWYIIQTTDKPKAINFKSQIVSTLSLRERQPDVVEFLLENIDDDNNSRLVTLPTGYGKGIVSLWAICKRQYRTAIIILPSYIEKFVVEITSKTTTIEKDIMVIEGSDSVRGLIELGKTNTYQSEYLLISMKTWTNYIDSYIKNPEYCVEDEYGCTPEDVFSLLGIGTVLIDEIHQHLHAVYKTFCFMNVDRAIGLSATFISPDYFIDKMQHIMFPREIRFEEVKMEKYIRAYGISYSIKAEHLSKLRTSERGNSTYSQNAFETSLFKWKHIFEKYLELIVEVVNNGYIDKYERGHKCIIFVRRIEMCEVITRHLQQRYRHLDIRKYNSSMDPYENLIEPDIRVTTQQSGGTAHDIPGLMTIISLDNMGSPVANLQMIGRLRKPVSGTARYYSVYCENILKHAKYFRERKELFQDRVASFKEFRSNIAL